MQATAASLPSCSRPEVGLGLRAPHYAEVLAHLPDVAFFEVHPENFFGGGRNIAYLEQMASHYPISLHGVGLSLGSAGPLCKEHIRQLRQVTERVNPVRISDHVSWSASGNAHLGDLLPLPYTKETLTLLCKHIDEVQQELGRQILVENPSSYLGFASSTIPEADFMNAVAEGSGCGVLLDINNIYVQAHNHGGDPYAYLATVCPEYVQQMHLAGHSEQGELLIDTHHCRVSKEVWELYSAATRLFTHAPTLIEWDKDIPSFEVLMEEKAKAEMHHMLWSQAHAVG